LEEGGARPEGPKRGGVLGHLAPPHQIGAGAGERSWAKPRPLLILMLFEPPRTRVQTTMFSGGSGLS